MVQKTTGKGDKSRLDAFGNSAISYGPNAVAAGITAAAAALSAATTPATPDRTQRTVSLLNGFSVKFFLSDVVIGWLKSCEVFFFVCVSF